MKGLICFSILSLILFNCIHKSGSLEQELIEVSNNHENQIDTLKGIDIQFYKIDLEGIPKRYKYLLKLSNETNGNELYSDTIFSKTGQIKYEDFNSDGILDILIQYDSDARSNWTYNLYLYNKDLPSIIKVDGFKKIKNPVSINGTDIIESFVVSGQNYYEYYRIINNSVCQLDTLVYAKRRVYDTLKWKKAHDSIIDKVEALECR